MSSSKISIVMSVYNGERYLQESVNSILNQTFSDFEFIIIDDGSTDGTWRILEKYASQDSRIVLVRNQKNIGLTRSLNKGLKLSSGKYIARQDADDISLPKRLEKEEKFLDEHPKVVLVSYSTEKIDSEGRSLGKFKNQGDPDFVAWHLLFYNYIMCHSQVMFRRDPVMDLGGYSEDRYYAQDYELWLRLVEVGDIVVLPETLVKWRFHSENISNRNSLEQESYALNDSRHTIAKLVGEEFSLDQIAELKRFWGSRFPGISGIYALNAQLKLIYRAFLEQRVQQRGALFVDLSPRLRTLIGEQFLVWAANYKFPRQILNKLKVSLYAFYWAPTGALGYWLAGIKKFVFRIWHT